MFFFHLILSLESWISTVFVYNLPKLPSSKFHWFDKENGFTLKKVRSSQDPEETMTDADYADDLALFVNSRVQAEPLLYNLEQGVGGIDVYVNGNKTECMIFKQKWATFTLSCQPKKWVD